jgi:hypothetical protein
VVTIYGENEHRTRTGAPPHTAAFPKWPFGVREVHVYDESEHRARAGAPWQSAADLIPTPMGLSTPPEPLKLKLCGELLVLVLVLALLGGGGFDVHGV